MTEKWIIRNGEIVNTETHMTFDSFMEIIIVLNGQSKELANLHEENIDLRLKIAELEAEIDILQHDICEEMGE